jgi:hypothetical protein
MDDLREIANRIKVGRVSEGALYYELKNPDLMCALALAKSLEDVGLEVHVVTDELTKKLLLHTETPNNSNVLRIEWDSEFVHRTWPSLKFEDPSMPFLPSLIFKLKVATSLAALLFILSSFLASMITDDRPLPEALGICGIGSLLLLLLLVVTDRG